MMDPGLLLPLLKAQPLARWEDEKASHESTSLNSRGIFHPVQTPLHLCKHEYATAKGLWMFLSYILKYSRFVTNLALLGVTVVS